MLHPKTVMKKVFLASFFLLTFLALSGVTGISAAAERIVDKVAGKVVLYVHVARLYTSEPDQKLAMPVEDISTKQVANTWHAPRGTDRLHEGQDIFAPRGTAVRLGDRRLRSEYW